MQNALEILKERGFVEQLTHEKETIELFNSDKPITFYIGFDATADSLHVGHFVTIMAMAHMQKCGHRPIALLGGGTTMVGDPSGKSDMRKMLTTEDIQHNADRFKEQLSKFIDFNDGKAILENNANWLMGLKYIDFLREVGADFNVNKMLSAECYKQRMAGGLTFLEFNYMIMQSYDFLTLNRKYNCLMELGGNDQWSNIIGGVDLIRKHEKKPAYGLTFKLLTTSEGKKMGKTEKGAVWLDKSKTTPYEFFQYWRNIEDAKVEECLALLTFLPMDEVKRLGQLQDAEINKAKEILAYEVTKIVHSEEDAKEALNASKALFAGGKKTGSIPETIIEKSRFEEGVGPMDLIVELNMCPSKSEARRTIIQNGFKVNDEKYTDIKRNITVNDFIDGELKLQRGKKVFHIVKLG